MVLNDGNYYNSNRQFLLILGKLMAKYALEVGFHRLNNTNILFNIMHY